MTAGPTPLPPEVSQVMAEPILYHRAPAFIEVYARVLERLKGVFQTENEVLCSPPPARARWSRRSRTCSRPATSRWSLPAASSASVGAEPVAEARRQQGLAEVDGQRIEGQKQGSEGCHHAQQRQHDGAGQERAVPPETADRRGAEADHDSFTRGSAMA